MSWNIEFLGNLLVESRISATNPNPNKRIRVKLNVAGVEKRPLENEIEGATKQFIRKSGQFIYGKQNFHKGAFGIIPPELDGFETSADIPSFDVRADCLPEWIFYFFKINNRYIELEKIARGMGSKRIHPEQLADIEIALPSLVDQKFFISKFMKLELSVSDVNDEHTHQLDLLKKLRQQILQDAVKGKLVPQDPNDEPATKLLERIKAEKEKLVQDKNIKSEKTLPPIKPEEIPFEIPKNWMWCKFDDLIYDKQNDVRTGPFGTSLNKSEHTEKGVPVLGIESISKDGKYTGFNKIFVTKEKSSQLKSFLVKGCDLIISRSGTIGELCMLPKDIEQALISTNLMKISLDSRVMLPELFCFIIKGGRYIKEMLSEFCSGSTRLFLTQSILNKLIFPLPPLNEQKLIVSKIDQLMTLCDEVEQAIQQNQKYLQELLQVALKEALELKFAE